MTAVTDNPVPLEPGVRCDRCGAEAFMRATKNDSSLHLCGHHGAAHTDALILNGFQIDDFRESINRAPSLSSA